MIEVTKQTRTCGNRYSAPCYYCIYASYIHECSAWRRSNLVCICRNYYYQKLVWVYDFIKSFFILSQPQQKSVSQQLWWLRRNCYLACWLLAIHHCGQYLNSGIVFRRSDQMCSYSYNNDNYTAVGLLLAYWTMYVLHVILYAWACCSVHILR